jgi:hypothetical protein
MNRMPTQIELEQSLGGQKASALTENAAKGLMDEERRSRLVRDSQIQDNCSVITWIEAEFDAESAGVVATDWIDFAQVHFVDKPGFMAASQRMAQEDEKALDPEGSNFDATEHLSVPGTAMVLAWRQDERGFYTGAKLLLFALASVPDGYKILISATWMGPAVRMGG